LGKGTSPARRYTSQATQEQGESTKADTGEEKEAMVPIEKAAN
jgi:hypothetical protein